MQDTVFAAEAVEPAAALDGDSDVWHMNRIHICLISKIPITQMRLSTKENNKKQTTISLPYP